MEPWQWLILFGIWGVALTGHPSPDYTGGGVTGGYLHQGE